MQSIGKTKGGWNTKLHLVSCDDKTVITLMLTAGNVNDAPAGRELLMSYGEQDIIQNKRLPLLMDKAYEGNETRSIASILNYDSIVPPKSNRKEPWEYDKDMYKNRNVVERLFRRVKEFRRIFTRYDKLDVMFLGFIYFGLVMIMTR
jgi:transposase